MNTIMSMHWRDISAIKKRKTCLFLTIAPIEEHGLYLPISTDIDLGEYWKEGAITLLKNRHPDFQFISLPFLSLASGSMKIFPGCVYIKPKLLRKVLSAYLAFVAGWGIKYLVCIASHGDPLHNMAIEKACKQTNRKFGTSFISPLGAMFSYRELGIDLKFPDKVCTMLSEYPNDFHAGWIETSMMLDINPAKVKPSYKEQEDVIVSEKDMINPRIYTRKTEGKGHLGYPRLADKNLGKMLNESTAVYIADVAEKLVHEKNVEKYSNHFLNKLLFLRMMI